MNIIKDAYEDGEMSQVMVFYLHRLFWECNEEVDDKECPEHPSARQCDERVYKVRHMFNSDYPPSVKMLAECNIQKTSVHWILTEDLAMRRCAKMIPKVLSED
ncbi:protein GVQW3-like [Hetaerina americana]|uniref:protein GVQW3-like n=1 Tax=Hetaerina americana TaxID=62018 RepID=UPI003A7F4317